jgi:hypothetical protein
MMIFLTKKRQQKNTKKTNTSTKKIYVTFFDTYAGDLQKTLKNLKTCQIPLHDF